jgi:hypothetical protein
MPENARGLTIDQTLARRAIAERLETETREQRMDRQSGADEPLFRAIGFDENQKRFESEPMSEHFALGVSPYRVLEVRSQSRLGLLLRSDER